MKCTSRLIEHNILQPQMFPITLVVFNVFYSTENLLMACLWDLVLAVLLVMALLPQSILTDSLLRSTIICLRHLDKKSE